MNYRFLRKIKGYIMLSLSALAAVIGVVLLFAILYKVIQTGMAGLNLALFTKDEAPAFMIGEGGMRIALAVYERRPFFWIVRHDEEGIALAEVGIFVRDGIYETVVLLLDRLHLFVEFGLLIYPIPAEAFKEADHAFFAEALDVRCVDIHLFE